MRRSRASPHLDLVHNDWDAEVQHLVARIYPSDHDVIVKAQDETRNWDDIVHQTLKGSAVAAGKPEFDRAIEILRGRYLFASAPHQDEKCPFGADDWLPMHEEKWLEA